MRADMRAWRLGGVLVALLLVLAACGGDDDDTTTTVGDDPSATSTTVEAAPTTTVAVDDDDDNGEVGSIGEMPEECRDVMVDYLQAIEPHVEDVDFETITLDELSTLGETIESDPALADFEARIDELECPDLSDPDSEQAREELLAIAESEAPGTVAFVAYSLDLAASFGAGDDSGGEASGDCETDIAALQEYVDAGGTMTDLTLSEVTAIGALMMSVQSTCSVERLDEFFTQPDVEAFLNG
jgi:hypothetical protein